MNSNFNIRNIFEDIRSQINIIGFGAVVSGIILFAIFLSSFYAEIGLLRVVMWMSAHPLALIILVVLLMPYLCNKRCETGRVIVSAIAILIAALSALLFLILTIISVIQVGCAGIPACNNIQGVFIVVMVLVGILALIETLMFLYLIIAVRATINKACNNCEIGTKVNRYNKSNRPLQFRRVYNREAYDDIENKLE